MTANEKTEWKKRKDMRYKFLQQNYQNKEYKRKKKLYQNSGTEKEWSTSNGKNHIEKNV